MTIFNKTDLFNKFLAKLESEASILSASTAAKAGESSKATAEIFKINN